MAIELRPEALDDLDDRVAVPDYDRGSVTPSVVHVGVGGFHRAHQARYLDELARGGDTDWGITGVGVMEQDAAMADALQPQEGLYTLVERSEEGFSARVIGSILEYVHAHPDRGELVDLIASDRTRILSMTITEGGYPVDDDGAFTRERPGTEGGALFDVIVEGLAARRAAGCGPVTILSCDNVQANGDVARTAVEGALADREDADLTAWVAENVTFPNSMVDRITPATTEDDKAWLRDELGVRDRWPVFCEPFTQWVVEDRFPAGRPPLEELGVIVTDDVEPYEACKLRLLNAAHTNVCYLARLVGHRWVHEVMAEDRFAAFLRHYLDDEAAPVVPEAPGIDVPVYCDTLLDRFANPAVRDQVDRLCLDGSVKVPTFVMPTVRDQLAVDGPVRLAALAMAGWCRYLLGEEEDGTPIDVASDPNLDEMRERARAATEDPAAFLDAPATFGPDLHRDDRFVEPFGDALRSLRERGVRDTIDRWLATDG